MSNRKKGIGQKCYTVRGEDGVNGGYVLERVYVCNGEVETVGMGMEDYVGGGCY